LLLEGNALGALEKVAEAFPEVLVDEPGDEGGGIRFKLRLREFIEAYQAATAGGGLTIQAEPTLTAHGEDDDPMDDDGSGSSTSADGDPAAWPMHAVMNHGRALAAEYMKDPRPAVQGALQQAFSLLAYADPAGQPAEVGWLVSQAARAQVAEEVNAAILVDQRLPAVPELEGLWRQAGAVVRCLGDHGVSGAALVRVREALE